MALQTSGTITLNDIHQEAGGPSGGYCTINDSDIRGLIGKSAGAYMAFNEWYGAAASVAIPFTPSSRTYAYGGASTYRRSGVHYHTPLGPSGTLYGSFTGTTSSTGLFGGNSINQIYTQHHNLTGTGSFTIVFNGTIANTDAAAFNRLNVNGTTIYRSSMSHSYHGSGSNLYSLWSVGFNQGGGTTNNIYPIYQDSYPSSTVTFYK